MRTRQEEVLWALIEIGGFENWVSKKEVMNYVGEDNDGRIKSIIYSLYRRGLVKKRVEKSVFPTGLPIKNLYLKVNEKKARKITAIFGDKLNQFQNSHLSIYPASEEQLRNFRPREGKTKQVKMLLNVVMMGGLDRWLGVKELSDSYGDNTERTLALLDNLHRRHLVNKKKDYKIGHAIKRTPTPCHFVYFRINQKFIQRVRTLLKDDLTELNKTHIDI